jgi:hypothetical protein
MAHATLIPAMQVQNHSTNAAFLELETLIRKASAPLADGRPGLGPRRAGEAAKQSNMKQT